MSSVMKRSVPGCSGLDHGVEDGQELAHAGHDGNHFLLSAGEQAFVETPDDRVVADGRHGWHIQGTAYVSAPAVDGSLSTHGAGVSVQWRHTDELADLSVGQTTELRQLTDEHGDA